MRHANREDTAMEIYTDREDLCDVRGGTRRNVLVGAIHALWAVMAAALGAPAFAYLLREPEVPQKREWIDVGDIAGLPSGQPVEMVFRHSHADGWKTVSEKLSAWVVKAANDEIVAFGPRCTHLGCAHHWDEAKHQFVCPCHSSIFSIEGTVLSGPAPRSLDRYEVKVEHARLLLGGLRRHPENES